MINLLNHLMLTLNFFLMKPLKFLAPVSDWLMRSGVMLFVLLYYLEIIKGANFSSVMFWISAGFFIFSILLFAGGFLKKSPITVVAALVLILLTGYHSFIFIKAGIDYNFAVFVVLGSVLIHFVSGGSLTEPIKVNSNE